MRACRRVPGHEVLWESENCRMNSKRPAWPLLTLWSSLLLSPHVLEATGEQDLSGNSAFYLLDYCEHVQSQRWQRNDGVKQCTWKGQRNTSIFIMQQETKNAFLLVGCAGISPIHFTYNKNRLSMLERCKTTQQSCRRNCRWRLSSIALLVLPLTIHWKTLD